MQRTLRKSVGANVGAEFRVVIKLRVLNNLGGEFESLRPASLSDSAHLIGPLLAYISAQQQGLR